MAQLSPPPLPLELPPPPPVYTEVPARTQSPYAQQQKDPGESSSWQERSVKSPVLGNTISLVVRDDRSTPQEKPLPLKSAMKAQTTRWPFDEADGSTSNQARDGVRPSGTMPEGRKPFTERPNATADVPRRKSPDNLTSPPKSYMGDRQYRSASTPIISDTDQMDNHQPLQYHHRAFEDVHMKSLNERTSRLTVGTSNSEASNNSDAIHRSDQLAPATGRVSKAPRPDSGFSSTSEFRTRVDSPRATSASHARAFSTASRSPDVRLSRIDLSNSQYPQAITGTAENLVNDQLRTAVGADASLLSTRKTLDMYRANVKKTSDPAIQYEFAVFMVGAAQVESLEPEIISDTSSQKSSGSVRNDLLKEAKHILQKLCDRSYPFAQYYLADGYASGLFNNGRPDLERSFPLFLAASKHGHAEAMYRTALCYEWGWGCRVDAAKAVQFYQHAASKNHPGAMLRLGRACLIGDMGLGVRYREGLRWLKRGAESADFQYNQAPYDLACLHETGYGSDVFKDEAYAAQLYTKSAELGHADAGFRMGEAYEYGQLTCPNDPALSIHFYTGAAEQNHAGAQMALCAWYMVGVENVLAKDESEAYEWASKAAEQGLPKAQYTMAYFTEMGIGCRRDILDANKWYVRAADQGEERAIHRLAAIRAAATGADPATAAKRVVSMSTAAADSDRKKRFSIFK